MNTLLRLLALLLLPLATVRAEIPGVPKTPPPPVTLSPPPLAPLLPSPGKPWFSVVTRDKKSNYEVYATVENGEPRDVHVEIERRALKFSVPAAKNGEKPAAVKLVSLPDSALGKIGNVKFEKHAVVVTIPKRKK